ncbi:hypothetical protein [Methylobacterium sp. Leaf94]|uniref:hypothetical protein n=1 Tax=Methylobacterium sp. Leaf94 TaxID=1736250 RepID=UPI000AF99AF3|nr:hypothetical protein [Methylobacterium sp. Leaf94]
MSHALTAAVITSLISAGVSVYSARLSYEYQSVTQVNQIKIDKVQKFDANSSEIVDALNTFIIAVNKSQDLTKAKEKFKTVLLSQIQDAESIKRLFGKEENALISSYQNEVVKFNKDVQTFVDAKDIGQWAENLGKVLDLRSDLVKQLQENVQKKST